MVGQHSDMSLQQFAPPDSWADILADFEIDLLGEGRSEETIKLRRRWVVRLARAVKKPPEQVTRRDILRFAHGQDWSPETRRSAYSSWRTFFAFCLREGVRDEPIEIPCVKRAKPSPRPADDRALTMALKSDDQRVALAVRLAAGAGLRRGEVVKVMPSRDLFRDLLGWSLQVHGKGGKKRVVPISDDLAQDLLLLPPGYAFPGQIDGHLSASYMGRLVANALPAGVTMHMLRHRFATRAYTATRDLVSVQTLLGHASPDTTIRYVQVVDERLRAVAAAAA